MSAPAATTAAGSGIANEPLFTDLTNPVQPNIANKTTETHQPASKKLKDPNK
ncbi:MAG: hypothetical protein ACRDAX_09910 [Propionibacteriaceae bacterium]